MGFSREHVLIGMPKITEGRAVFVFMRDGFAITEGRSRGLRSPIAKATIWRVRRHIAVHNHRAWSFLRTQLQISSSSSTSSGIAGRRVSLTSGRFSTSALSHPAMVCRATAKIRATPRRLHRCRQARSTVCCSVSPGGMVQSALMESAGAIRRISICWPFKLRHRIRKRSKLLADYGQYFATGGRSDHSGAGWRDDPCAPVKPSDLGPERLACSGNGAIFSDAVGDGPDMEESLSQPILRTGELDSDLPWPARRPLVLGAPTAERDVYRRMGMDAICDAGHSGGPAVCSQRSPGGREGGRCQCLHDLLARRLSLIAKTVRDRHPLWNHFYLPDVRRNLGDDCWWARIGDQYLALLYLSNRIELVSDWSGGNARCHWRDRSYPGRQGNAPPDDRAGTIRKDLTHG